MSRWTPDPDDLDAATAINAGRDPLLVRAARYARWDGTQTIPALDADEILDALADDVMAEGDLAEALRRLMERGWRTSDPSRPDLAGLNDLRERLRRRREELQERYQLRDVLADVRQELDEIVAQERAGIERRLDEAATPADDTASDAALRAMLRDAAARRIDQLDALPRDVGGRIRKLEEYDFMEPAARDRFNELTERLRKQTLDRFVEGLSEAIQGTTPEDLAANRDMVRDLNSLLEERLEGREPSQDEVDDFLAKHGRFFPGARTLDDIVEQLTQRMAAMQSLLRSMTSQQRAELQSMMDALLRDDRLRWDLARLASNMDQLMPDGLGEGYEFSGEEPLGLEPALDRIGQLQALDALEDQLGAVEEPGDLAGLDRDATRELLGPESARDLEALDELARQLERAGYLTRRGERLELTPRGSRRIGQKVLDDLFARLSRDAFGGHRIDRAGRGGEREETTKPYEFGDPFHLDIRGTIENAIRRKENAPFERLARGEPGVRLSPEDFEVFRTEQMTRTSTVLLVDMSRSMLLRGCFVAAKKVAVALDTLIRTQFPHDDLTVIGFAYYARELRPEALAELTWHGYEYGTNLQHGLMLARRILARQRGADRQIVVITDGEPTAHFENGQVEFSYPPTRRTIQETLREVQRCTRDGITINTFMLERSRALAEFVALVTRMNRGRAFYATPERLGEYVLVDFVSNRTRGVG
ncbi:MAG TPA: VWA domain-containing protein [Verrucomicrobiae bacterium]|nr:VWA domain-containing protein [Verrucomicrobiae bacterium]